MRFPLLAVQRLLFCTAFQPGGGGGGIPSPLPPDKKKRRGAAHPTPTSTSDANADGDDVSKILTPTMAVASLGGDDEGECGAVLGQQQDDDDYFEGDDGDDNSMSDEDVAYFTSECILEESLDNDDGESKPAAIRDAIKNNDPTYQLRGGDFAKHYDGLLKSDEVSSPEFKAFIIKLVKWVNSIDLHAFGTAKEMESNFNQKRDEIKKEMVAALKKNGREDIATTINLASKFSIGTLILFFLHYAPSGCNPVDDDDCNFCRLDQCCIDTMAKKLLNFFINEEKHGSEKMKKWNFGGRSDINKSSKIAFIDMFPTTLEKCDNDREMQQQYKTVAMAFGLQSYYDLMSISYVMLQMHVLLFAKVKEERGLDGKRLQIHVASSATNKYIYGNGPGLQKYLERYVSPNYEQSSGPHPQLWLMGGTKNENVWPDDVRRVITSNLKRVYENVHIFRGDFESDIMRIFGNSSFGVAVGLYSHTARVFEDASLLDLDMRSELSEPHQQQSEYLKSILTESGVSDAIINFMVIELKASSLSSVMRRLRSFNASRRMGFIASNLSDTTSEFLELTSDVQAMIKGLSSALGKTVEVVLRKLQRMKTAQDNIGLMQIVASNLPDTESSFAQLSPDVKAMIRDLSSTLRETTEIVLEKLQRIKTAQDNNGERLSSLSHSLHYLAKEFNDATGGIEERQIAITSLPEFISFMDASGRDHTSATDREAAIEAVMKTARAYDKTFWKYFTKLVAYIGENENDVVNIRGIDILTIDTSRDRENNKTLKAWLEAMNGYSSHKNYYEEAYGLKAYKMMGSIEQRALAENYVCFDPVLYGEAIDYAHERKFSSNQVDLLSSINALL